MAPLGPGFDVRGHKQLHIGIGAHDGPDVPTVQDGAGLAPGGVGSEPALEIQDHGADRADRGKASIYPRVLQEMQERDARDGGRAVAPLRPAEGAIVLDTTEMDADAALEAALKLVATRRRAEEA